MPPERLPPNDPRQWLNRARSDLALATAEQIAVYLEDLCFHAQQAAEKALKGLLLSRGIRFPYVHDLGILVNLLEDNGVRVPREVLEAVVLSGYAVESRYPGSAEPITEEEHQRAVVLSERVVDWVALQLPADDNL
jgi:HEPN domain-containing protein